MCGISGLVYRSINPSKSIEAMNKRIEHRGPDNSSFQIFSNLNLALGHTRLSIIDLHSESNQPMYYKDRYCIVFNGEIYNYIEIKDELILKGYIFTTKSDTEVIMAAYDCWKEDCLHKFNGMFSFLLLDKSTNYLFGARDRLGIKPLYYTKLEDGSLCFASEIKQFFDLADFNIKYNEQMIVDYLNMGQIDHTLETIYDGVNQIRGGEKFTYQIDNGKFDISRWWSLSDAKSCDLSYEKATEKFSELFIDSVKLRLRADVTIGSCLSGGLDSSSIVATANKLVNSSKQKTFSACYEDKKFDEREYIDEMSDMYDFDSHYLFPDISKVPEKIKEMIYIQDGPFISTSIYAQWSVFKEAHDNDVTVMLDGQGADEMLAGYHTFYYAYLSGLLSKFQISDFIKAIKSIRNLHGYSSFTLLKYTLLYSLPTFIKEYRQSKQSNSLLSKYANVLFRDLGAIKAKGISGLSKAQLLHTNLPALLHYEDRNSMAHSVEARVPFLDYRLVEFVYGLEDNYKIREGWTKAILRDGPAKNIPESIRLRKDKMGFVTPENTFFNNNIETLDFIRDVDDPLLDTNKINAQLDMIKRDKKGYTSNLWRIACYVAWKDMNK